MGTSYQGNQVAYPQVIAARGELIEPTQSVNLTVQFKDDTGAPVNTDAFPQISIISPSGLVILTPTSAGVTQAGIGNYSFIFTVPINGPFGVFNDVWSATINGVPVQGTLQFVVTHTDLPGINSDGYVHLGDDPGFNFSQNALLNINKVIKGMKARLNSAGKAPSIDANGNLMYVDCDIYSIDMLTTFAAISLSKFNQTPYFTFFTYEHTQAIDQFYESLVEGAVLYALSSKALIERGREFQITDNSINFNPPSVAEMLSTQWNTELTHYWESLKYIKNSLRPGPLGLGVFGMTSAMNPAFARLRHLRERRII